MGETVNLPKVFRLPPFLLLIDIKTRLELVVYCAVLVAVQDIKTRLELFLYCVVLVVVHFQMTIVRVGD